MARTKTEEYEFSLFPFMGVLAGVIGVLVLVISGLAIIGMSQSVVAVELEGNTQDKKPVIVECCSNKVILHQEGETETIRDFTNNALQFEEFLADVERNLDTQHLVLLIRPDGIETFQVAEASVKARYLPYGFDVLLSEQKIKILN